MTRIKVLTALALVATFPGAASALNRICDPAFEDCRAPLIQLIDQEATRIDVAYWFMEDARYSAALGRAKRRGVDVRVLFDSESLPGQPTRQIIVNDMIADDIPIREKTSPGILHWKMMLFTAQNTVQFSGANYTSEAFVYEVPYSAYVDEVIYFTHDQAIVNSFKTKFDDIWISTDGYTDYANEPSRTRAHPIFPIDPRMNFSPGEGFRERSVAHYNAETQGVDAIIYRITDRAHTDALILALQRGVRVRLLTEPHQYRDETRLWHAWNVDRLYMAGLEVQGKGLPGSEIRHRGHAGLNHEKLTLLRGQGMTVFGSSNWTSASSDYQDEHNIFTTDQVFFTWANAHFNRKWFNQGPSPESTAFAPLPPDQPQLVAPANQAVGQPVSITLLWSPGPWAHRYDVYLGTSPSNLSKVVDDVELGPYEQGWNLSGLSGGTTYYWYVVSRTMANLTATSGMRSFTTAGAPSGNAPPTVTLTSPVNGASFPSPGTISLAANASDVDGAVARVDFYSGSVQVGSDSSSPYETGWNAPAGTHGLTARAIDNAGATTTSSVVTITVGSGSQQLPAPWAQQDVGSVGAAGSASVSGGTWTVSGSGADVWGTEDAFHFVHQPLNGNGSVVARVNTIQNVDQWTKAGVMIRQSLTPGSAHAFMIVTPGGVKGLAFQRRTATGAVSTHTAGGAGTAPAWVKLTRSGNTITAWRSGDGANWTLVGSDTVTMGAAVNVGLAVSSHNNSAVATATFDNVTVTADGGTPPPQNAPPTVAMASPANGATFTAPATIQLSANAGDSDGSVSQVDFFAGTQHLGTSLTANPYTLTWNNVSAGTYTLTARATDNSGAETMSAPVTVQVGSSPPPSSLPQGWNGSDIGAVGAAGSSSFANGTFTVEGSGADIWNSADGFQFAYRTMTGDGTIVARVDSVESVNAWTKAGVMIRASLTPGSRHAMMIVSAAKGLAFQRRVTDGAASVHTPGSASTAPAWVRLQRAGSTITASASTDGINWTVVGTETIAMPNVVFVGLPVTSHTDGVLATATFSNVTVP